MMANSPLLITIAIFMSSTTHHSSLIVVTAHHWSFIIPPCSFHSANNRQHVFAWIAAHHSWSALTPQAPLPLIIVTIIHMPNGWILLWLFLSNAHYHCCFPFFTPSFPFSFWSCCMICSFNRCLLLINGYGKLPSPYLMANSLLVASACVKIFFQSNCIQCSGLLGRVGYNSDAKKRPESPPRNRSLKTPSGFTK